MSEENEKDSLNILMAQWAQAIESKNHHEALLFAISCYLLSRERKDAKAEIIALGAIDSAYKRIYEPLMEKRREKRKQEISCSFCGRSEPEVKLAAGPNAFICNACVNDLYSVFQ